MRISEVIKDRYESQYSDYRGSAWRSIGAVHKVDNIMQLCGLLPHERILEIGAGDGAVLESLRKNSFGQEWCALEITSSAVAILNSKGIPSQVFDGGYVPYDDNSLDLVILTHVVEHLEHPRMILREAARVARHVFVEVPLEHTIRMKDEDVFRPVGHLNYYTASTARMLLISAGFDIVGSRFDNPSRATYVFGQGRVKGTLVWLIRELGLKLFPAMATKIFTYHYAMVGSPRRSLGLNSIA